MNEIIIKQSRTQNNALAFKQIGMFWLGFSAIFLLVAWINTLFRGGSIEPQGALVFVGVALGMASLLHMFLSGRLITAHITSEGAFIKLQFGKQTIQKNQLSIGYHRINKEAGLIIIFKDNKMQTSIMVDKGFNWSLLTQVCNTNEIELKELKMNDLHTLL